MCRNNLNKKKGANTDLGMNTMVYGVLILAVGFVLLIKGADFFVEGSSSVAKRLKVPSMIIGLTIVAMGTSLPECAVSVTASISGNNGLAVSNVIGSNIFNLIVVCGACALFVPLKVQADTLKKEYPFSMFCAVLLLLFGYLGMRIGRADGVILLVIFTVYLLQMIRSAMQSRAGNMDAEEDYAVLPVAKCILFILGGMAAIKFGGDFVIDGAVTIAEMLGLSQNLIGLTIVAMGTSLPELVTSLVAARKNEVDMAIGNVLGSNIFNILLILGIASVISPIDFVAENMIDIACLLAMSLLAWRLNWTRSSLNRKEGILLLGVYAAYMVYICIR